MKPNQKEYPDRKKKTTEFDGYILCRFEEIMKEGKGISTTKALEAYMSFVVKSDDAHKEIILKRDGIIERYGNQPSVEDLQKGVYEILEFTQRKAEVINESMTMYLRAVNSKEANSFVEAHEMASQALMLGAAINYATAVGLKHNRLLKNTQEIVLKKMEEDGIPIHNIDKK